MVYCCAGWHSWHCGLGQWPELATLGKGKVCCKYSYECCSTPFYYHSFGCPLQTSSEAQLDLGAIRCVQMVISSFPKKLEPLTPEALTISTLCMHQIVPLRIDPFEPTAAELAGDEPPSEHDIGIGIGIDRH